MSPGMLGQQDGSTRWNAIEESVHKFWRQSRRHPISLGRPTRKRVVKGTPSVALSFAGYYCMRKCWSGDYFRVGSTTESGVEVGDFRRYSKSTSSLPVHPSALCLA